MFGMALLATGQFVTAAPSTTTKSAATSTGSYMPQVSPEFGSLPTPTGVVTQYNYGPYNTSDHLATTTLKGYPTPWEKPDVTHPEIKAAVKKIDWSLVPKAPVRKQDSEGNFKPDTDGSKDPYCWWSDTNCVKPKIKTLPPDYYMCPNKGDWGLSYDDGPFNLYDDENAATQNKYAEPALYNFLVENNNQKATLFVSRSCFRIAFFFSYFLYSILDLMLLLTPKLLSVLLITDTKSVFTLGLILL